mmetsp:Transcript_44927/g.126870  ORF Transcript_44927/g.126870 Transcript_44927/m.126870 type:complete len:132 (+) Transcript_44927:275-670(+)
MGRQREGEADRPQYHNTHHHSTLSRGRWQKACMVHQKHRQTDRQTRRYVRNDTNTDTDKATIITATKKDVSTDGQPHDERGQHTTNTRQPKLRRVGFTPTPHRCNHPHSMLHILMVHPRDMPIHVCGLPAY